MMIVLHTMYMHLNERLRKIVPNYLKKKKTSILRRQWQIPDVSWRSHSQNLMAIKLSKHRTNKEKISSHHVKSAHRKTHCCGKFWDKHKDFFFTVICISCLQAAVTKWKKKNPSQVSIPRSWLLQRDPILRAGFAPSSEHKSQHYICWNQTLIKTKKFFFLSLLWKYLTMPLWKIEKCFCGPLIFPKEFCFIFFQTLELFLFQVQFIKQKPLRSSSPSW